MTAFLFELPGRQVRVQVQKEKRKTYRFELIGRDQLLVHTPSRATTGQVQEVMRAYQPKVLGMLERWQEPPPAPALTPAEFAAWKEAAEKKAGDLWQACCREVGLAPTYVKLKEQTSIWGSCTAKRGINLNIRLLYCPRQAMRYVMIHELCHLRHPNHGPAFWQMVAGFVPDYKAQRKWLREHGAEILRRPLGLPMA